MTTSPPSPPKKGSHHNPALSLFGDSVRYKISVMRKSAAGSPTLKKNSLNNSSFKGKSSLINKVVNENVSFYVNRCNTHRVEPILEYVVAISEPSTTTCALNDRKRPLTDQDMALISESLRTNTNIKDLDLSGNGISLGGATELALALKVNQTISKLILAGNELKSEGVLRIAAALRENRNGSSLQILDLRSNQIGNHGVAGLSEILASDSFLEELDLQRNMVKDQGVIALSAALKVNTTLRVLNLRFNELTDTGAIALGATLRMNNGLTELDIGGNKIGNEGAEAIAAGLCENSTLMKLNLRSNLIGDAGAMAIAECLKRNSTLKELFLGSNNIAATGCTAIADAFKENHTLTKVDLQGIAMGVSGALAIADALRINTSISHLVVDLEKVGKEEAMTIAAAIRANPTLTELNIGEDTSEIDEEILNAISSTLKLNRYVAGISEETGFSEYFQNRPLSATGKRSTGRSSSPAPVTVSPTHSMEMNEVLSTMGDKLKNLQQQMKKERESNKSNKQFSQMPPPHNPRILSSSSSFVGEMNDAPLAGNSQWEPLTEEALSSSPTKDLRNIPLAPSPLPQPSPHPQPHPAPHPYSHPSQSLHHSRPSIPPSSTSSTSTTSSSPVSAPRNIPSNFKPPQFGQPPPSSSSPSIPPSTIPSTSFPSTTPPHFGQPSSAQFTSSSSSSSSFPSSNPNFAIPTSIPTSVPASAIPHSIPTSAVSSPHQPSLNHSHPSSSPLTSSSTQPLNHLTSPQQSSQPHSSKSKHNEREKAQNHISNKHHASSTGATSTTIPYTIFSSPSTPSATPRTESEPQSTSSSLTPSHSLTYTVPPEMEGWAKAFEQRLAAQDKAIASIKRSIETKHNSLLDEFKAQLVQQENDFKAMHDQQVDLYKQIKVELVKMADDTKIVFAQGDIPTMTKLKSEVVNTPEVQTIRKEADSLRARVAEMEPMVNSLRQSVAILENDLSTAKSRAHDPALSEVKRQLRDLEERVFGPNSEVLGLGKTESQRIDERLRIVERSVKEKEEEKEEEGTESGLTTEEDESKDGKDRRVKEKVRGLVGLVKYLEERVKADSGRVDRRMGEMLKRMEMLEDALRSEQETSLKALEAILAE